MLLFLLACSTDPSPADSASLADGGLADGGFADGGADGGLSDGGADSGADGGGDGGAEPWVEVGGDPLCDNLSPVHCMLPWPSDRYLVADATTETGFRVEYQVGAIPMGPAKVPFDVAPYRRLDGMSAASQILVGFGAPLDLSDAAGQDDIGRSLEADSPTLLIDLTTLEAVAHWVENDAMADDAASSLVLMHPAARLLPDRDYLVVYRDLVALDGAALSPSPAVEALLARQHTDAPDVEARWAAWQAAVDAAGIPREGILSAWRFHTASDTAIQRDLLWMRQDALERLGPGGIGCTVTAVEEEYGSDPVSFRKVTGTYTVPSYMNSPVPPALISRGEDDLPQFVDYVEVPFTAIVPHSLADARLAGPVVTFGHGLLGNADGFLSDTRIRGSAEIQGTVIVGTDWAGMSTPDLVTVAGILADAGRFPYLTERLHQAMINMLALTRTFTGDCAMDPAFQVDGSPLIDPSRRYYAGGSQGGILGGTYLALAEDIDKGVLIVGATELPFIMERSIAFSPYFPFFEASYPVRNDRAVLLSAAQQLWESTDSSAWLRDIQTGTEILPPKEFLYITAKNDAQVGNLASDVAMRTAGLSMLDGSSREAWGIETVDPGSVSSGYITIDMGDPAVPTGNEAPLTDAGGHNTAGASATAQTLISSFVNGQPLVVDCDGLCDPD